LFLSDFIRLDFVTKEEMFDILDFWIWQSSQDTPLLTKTARYNAMLSRTKYTLAVIGKIERRFVIM